MSSSHQVGVITRTYQYQPTPAEARLDIETEVVREHGQHATVDCITVCEVLTTHLFDA